MNIETIYLNGYEIDIYINNLDNRSSIPLIILNSYKEEKLIDVIKLIQKEYSFALADIKLKDWSKLLSPYKIKSNDFFLKNLNGEGENHLKFIDNLLIPHLIKYFKFNFKLGISYNLLAGYSLGGLFAIYGGLNSRHINKIVSVSGSLWYPNFRNYIVSLKLNNSITSIYISLGDKEKKTKNVLMKEAENETLRIYEYLKSIYQNVYFEFNNGNHFFQKKERLAKGIAHELMRE